MYAVGPMRTRSKLRPCSDSDPFPPLPATIWRLITKGTPLSEPEPDACTEVAPSAAALAAATILSADFDATPFELLFEPPQPASTARVRAARMARTRRKTKPPLGATSRSML